jgi:propanol-preferring alcohol dehydrogenase
MSDVPPLPYRLLYGERVLRTVANNTRADGRAFLEEAARLGIRTHTELYALDAIDDALCALKHDAIRGAGVVCIE